MYFSNIHAPLAFCKDEMDHLLSSHSLHVPELLLFDFGDQDELSHHQPYITWLFGTAFFLISF